MNLKIEKNIYFNKKLYLVSLWLKKNIDKEDIFNQLCYIIYVLLIEELNKDKQNVINVDELKNEFNSLKLYVETTKFSRISEDKLKRYFYLEEYLKEIKRDEQFKKSDEKKYKTDYLVDLLFKKNEDIKILNKLQVYNKDINFYLKLDLYKTKYIDLEDLHISYLPKFVEYKHYLCILVWIMFCKVYDKKSDKKNSFLYDIYLFQKQENQNLKIEVLIVVLEKISNYIQYHDYEKSKKVN